MDTLRMDIAILFEILRIYREGYGGLINEVSEQIVMAANMGQQNVDSHVLLEMCQKHHKTQGHVLTLLEKIGGRV